MKTLIVIGGPTASGKTRFAITLAKKLNAPILSADSRQFYKEMTIGTARPDSDELAAAAHHFIGHLSINEPYSVGAFEREAIDFLAAHYQQHDYAILVGGSGLYIKAVCEGLNEFPDVPDELKIQIEKEYKLNGLGYLQKAVAELDPSYFTQVDQQNPHRLMRALSVMRASGKPFSSFWDQELPKRSFTPIFIQLQWPRKVLYDRINQRVDQMISKGLEEEAKALLPYQQHKALQTVGYQEFFDFFNGNISKKEAIELIKRNSRRYAKRQMTWYRRDGLWKLVRANETALALDYIRSVRQEDLTIRYVPINEQHSAIKADKHLVLNISRQEEIVLSALIFQRKHESLVMVTQWPEGYDDWKRLLIHEFHLLHIDSNAYLIAPCSIPYFSALKAGTALPKWIKTSSEYLKTGKVMEGRIKDQAGQWFCYSFKSIEKFKDKEE